jgi:glycosyltransferase involved in cell wall biosynthesis
MRVLHVLPTRAASYGGPTRVAEGYAARLAPLGVDCQIYPPPGVEPPRNLQFYPGLRGTLGLVRAVRRTNLVHVHGLWTVPTTAAASLARAFGKPYVVTPHGMLDRWSMRQSARKKQIYAALAERRTLAGASAIHFFNAEEAEEAQDFMPLDRTFLLPNGVELASFADMPGRAELEAAVPETRGKTVALFLGRIHPKKGFDIFLPAMAKVAAPELLFLIAGPDEGGYRAEVEAMARSLGVADKLHFVGQVDGEAKRRLLGGADFFVLSSHQEGDSVAIKEALAAGLPVLISTCCHLPEVAAFGAGMVTADTAASVAEALPVLLRPEERARQAAAARELARRYDTPTLAGQLARVYQAILAGRALP